jgi:hypothetical protein
VSAGRRESDVRSRLDSVSERHGVLDLPLRIAPFGQAVPTLDSQPRLGIRLTHDLRQALLRTWSRSIELAIVWW